MAWNGSGTFSRLYNWVTDRNAGVKIQATREDAEDDGFATGINACLAKNGENAATGNLNLGGFRLTNAGNATARTDLLTAAQYQDGAIDYALTTGTNTIAATLTPAITAYANGQVFILKLGNTTTAASTLNINGVGALNIYHPDGTTALIAGAGIQNNIYMFAYDSSLNAAAGGFICINPSRVTGSATLTLVQFASLTGTMNYTVLPDGHTVYLNFYADITATSTSSTALTATGFPAALETANPTYISNMVIRDNAVNAAGGQMLITNSTTLTFGNSPPNLTGAFPRAFTASTGRGIPAQVITYQI